jgi:MFS family permease
MTAEPMDSLQAQPIEAHAGFKVGGGYAWYVLAIATVICGFSLFDRQVLSIVTGAVKSDLHLSNTDMGILSGTVFAIFYAVFGIPLGRLADGWNRSKLLALAVIGWSAACMLCGLASGFAMFAIARAGVAVGEAMANPAAYSVLSDWFPKKSRATALAIYSAGIAFGVGGSQIIGGMILDAWKKAYPTGLGAFGLHGWQIVFLGIGAPGMLVGLWALTLREPPRGLSDGTLQPNSPNPLKDAWNELLAVLPLTCQWRLWRLGAKPREIVLSLAALVVIALGIVGMTHFTQGLAKAPLPPMIQLGPVSITSHGLEWITIGLGLAVILGWVQSYGLTFWSAQYAITHFHATPGTVGFWLGMVMGGVGLVATLLGGWWADLALRFSPRGRVYVSYAVMVAVAPLALLTFASTTFTQFLVTYGMLSFATVIWLPGIVATGQDLMMPRMRGAAAATYNLATSMFGLGLGPFWVGLVSDRTGSLSQGILSLYWLSPLVWIAMFILTKGLPKAEATRLERARAAGEPV